MPDLLTFSFSGDFDRNRLIDEAIEVILYADVQMGKIPLSRGTRFQVAYENAHLWQKL